MKSTRWLTCGALSIIVIALAITLPVYAYNRPLGPSLVLVTQTNSAAGVDTTEVKQQSIQMQPAQANSTSTPETFEANISKKGSCGGEGKMNLLLLGESLPASAPHGADAIRLVVVDYNQPSVRVLSMPAELLVKTTLLKDIKETTLTTAYWYGKQPPPNGEPAAVRRATEVVAQALLDNFGYKTETYLALKEDVFVDVVNTIRGVEVNVSPAVDGTPEGYGIYEAGPQIMDGQRALNYVRMIQPARQPPSEWARFARQNQVIYGLQTEILQPENWLKIPRLINDFYHFLYTDMSPKELVYLNCMIQTAGGNVTVMEVTPQMVTIGADGVMRQVGDAISQLIKSFQNGS